MKLTRLIVLCVALTSSSAFAAYTLFEQQIYYTGSAPDVAAIGDIDGDGRDDVVVATKFSYDDENDFHLFVFLQKSDGTLAAPKKYPTLGANLHGLAMADLDRDGSMEIVLGQAFGITIFDWGLVKGRVGMRTRSYSNDEFDPGAGDVAVLDVDRDGNLDIVGQSWNGGAVVYLGAGDGQVSRMRKLATDVVHGDNDVKSGDFNGDGYDDFAVYSSFTPDAFVFYNDGTDDFAPPLHIDPPGDTSDFFGVLGAGDFNNDGRDDLVLKQDNRHLALYRQSASGTFLPPLTLDTFDSYPYGDPQAMIGRDLDLDGRDDLIVRHGGSRIGIYFQDAAGQLAPEVLVSSGDTTWYNTQTLAVGDLNGDSCPDIANADEFHHGLVVLYGSGCNSVADLAVSLGMTASVVAVRLDNFGAAAAAAPEARVDLSVLNGTLTVGLLPMGCKMQSSSNRTSLVTCIGGTLASGTSRTVHLPITLAGGDVRNALNVRARATTTTLEQQLKNNATSQLIRVVP